MTKINDIEAQIARKLREPLQELGILPAGYDCAVRLHRKERAARRSADFEKNRSPDSDSIRITFEPIAERVEKASPKEPQRENTNSVLSDLIRALDRAESRPGYEFIALKWFRDTALISEGFSWSVDESVRHNVLRDAIDQRLILTHKVPNPKSPQFPVTAIRLNRLMPEVKAVLGTRDREIPDFRPVPIRGEGLSATVLRDRR